MAVEYFSTPGNWVKLLNSNDEAEYMVYWLIPGELNEDAVKRKNFREISSSHLLFNSRSLVLTPVCHSDHRGLPSEEGLPRGSLPPRGSAF